MDNSVAAQWMRFLRRYGPVANNDNMYDETIERSARRNRVRPIWFDHPQRADVLQCFTDGANSQSVILTGTAGDGKTHLCRQVWEEIKPAGDSRTLDVPYLSAPIPCSDGRLRTLHIIKDLSEFAPQGKAEWVPDRRDLLVRFCASLFATDASEQFLIAANDGQLIEAWRRLPDVEPVEKAREVLETLLVENCEGSQSARLKFFNLSRGSSVTLLNKALDAFLAHEGWESCFASEEDAYGPESPIRRNYELLQSGLVQSRLRALFELCDFNDLHIPIRQILMLLTNAVLGHPDCKERLMAPRDVTQIIAAGTVAKASLYNNLFGGNLRESDREALPVFAYLDRFRIGYETTNRVDNLLIFGEAQEELRADFDRFLGQDTFYGATASYRAAQEAYVEGADQDDGRGSGFLSELVSQRRALFFKVPEAEAEDAHLWELTVFGYAGEYLREAERLKGGGRASRAILGRLVQGLNRVFTGMLVSSDQELILATSLSFSHSRVSRMLEERISISPRLGEKVELVWREGWPVLKVALLPTVHRHFVLNLVRYEFLSRVAEGALPTSFSKECFEDVLSFKSQILSALARRKEMSGDEVDDNVLVFKRLDLNESGQPSVQTIEVPYA